MKTFGIITLSHWMSRKIDANYTAYVEHEDRLVRLKRVTSAGGHLRPVFFTNDPGLSQLIAQEFFDIIDDIELNTLVFLSEDNSLAGVYIDDIVEARRILKPCSG